MEDTLAHATLRLFDAVPDIVYFVKDAAGRYVAVNDTLVARLGKASKADVMGRGAAQLFPETLARRIVTQDEAVIKRGQIISGELELHIYPDGRQGWCLTWKEPWRDGRGRITGLTGISRDVQPLHYPHIELGAVATAVDYVRANLDQPLKLADVAAKAGLSVWQFDQRIRALFGVSAGQFITRNRVERACAFLRSGDEAIAQVAQACGYGDQAAFTRQFRQSVGLTPRAYRQTMKLW